MPYSNRYVMQQMARGRPIPQGQPEPHLHRAIENVSPMDMEAAIQMGARVDVPDAKRRTSAHILLDHAMTSSGGLRVDGQRLVACLRVLVRNNANFNLPHAASGETAIGRMAPLAALPVGALIRQIVAPRINWSQPVCQGGESARQTWERYAAQQVFPTNTASPRPRVR